MIVSYFPRLVWETKPCVMSPVIPHNPMLFFRASHLPLAIHSTVYRALAAEQHGAETTSRVCTTIPRLHSL